MRALEVLELGTGGFGECSEFGSFPDHYQGRSVSLVRSVAFLGFEIYWQVTIKEIAMGLQPGVQQVDTTCGSLLRELQHIWDEVGESDSDRDKMLLQLEQECLEVYRRKVDNASHNRALLHKTIADAEGEFAALFSALGELTLCQR